MGTSIVIRTGEFYGFANYALDMLKQTPFVVYVGYATLVLGFLGIVTGLLLALAGLFVNACPKLHILALLCLLGVGAGNIAAGALIQQGVTVIDNAIYNPGPTPAPSAPFVSSFVQNVTHFQLAMFNACCPSQGVAGYSKEIFSGSVPESYDTNGYVKWCGSLRSDNLADMFKPNSLRSCFLDQETYRQFNYSVGLNQPKICYALATARVNIVGKKIPGTNIDVQTYLQGVSVVPIVGTYNSPTYGCGFGYGKGVQAAMLIWAENLISPAGTAFIACGAIYLFLVVITLGTYYACSRGGTETAEERYARYLEEINTSSQAANKQVSDAIIVDSFEQNNPNRMSTNMNRQSVNNLAPIQSNRLSVQSYATHGSQQSGYGGAQQQQQYPELNFNVDDKI